MKMSSDHFSSLCDSIAAQKNRFASAILVYKQNGLSKERFAWDVLRASGLRPGDSKGMQTGWPVYDYLNDSHIQTALFAALKKNGIVY